MWRRLAGNPAEHGVNMERQTFALSEHALSQIRQLSKQTGVPQSRLLEVAISDLVTEYESRDDKETFVEVIWMATSGTPSPGRKAG